MNKNSPQKSVGTGESPKYCLLCGKPHKLKTKLCGSCNKKSIDFYKTHIVKSNQPKYGKGGKASIGKLLWLKEKYNTTDIFAILNKNPNIYYQTTDRSAYRTAKFLGNEKNETIYGKSEKFVKFENTIPDYITNEFKKHPTKGFLTIGGNKRDPLVYYVCKLCQEEQVQKISDLSSGKGHNCPNNKSSGEFIVEEYLSTFCKFKTQHNTLYCTNPTTNFQLPYDIEITDKKTLIEIQGEQHFKFIEYFHGTIENFEYQQKKDEIKKNYAESKGYTLICLNYTEIESGSYKKKLKLFQISP